MTLLLSSAGRRVELLQCFRRSAAELSLHLRVLATDMAPELSAACHCADRAFPVPPYSAPDFVNEMLTLCRSEKVDLFVPTIDPELDICALNKKRFEQLGTRLALSSPAAVAIARDKMRTAEFLRRLEINVPRTSPIQEFIQGPKDWNFPVVLKPIDGSSSAGVHRVNSANEVRMPLHAKSYIAQEWHAGPEYTVNMFFDSTGLRCAIPHRRLEVRAGEVSKARTERVPVLMEIAERLGTALKGQAFGALCFQAIVTPDEEATVFEINARFGGGYPLAHHAGAEFTRWLLEIAAGRPCTAHNNWREDVLMLRYDSAIFSE